MNKKATLRRSKSAEQIVITPTGWAGDHTTFPVARYDDGWNIEQVNGSHFKEGNTSPVNLRDMRVNGFRATNSPWLCGRWFAWRETKDGKIELMARAGWKAIKPYTVLKDQTSLPSTIFFNQPYELLVLMLLAGHGAAEMLYRLNRNDWTTSTASYQIRELSLLAAYAGPQRWAIFNGRESCYPGSFDSPLKALLMGMWRPFLPENSYDPLRRMTREMADLDESPVTSVLYAPDRMILVCQDNKWTQVTRVFELDDWTSRHLYKRHRT